MNIQLINDINPKNLNKLIEFLANAQLEIKVHAHG